MSKKIENDLEYLPSNSVHYIPPPSPLQITKQQSLENQESFFDELNRKKGAFEKLVEATKKNPFVPFGCLLTAGVLINGIWAMKKGDSKKSQLMMRYRVGAQGATVIALVLGTMYAQFINQYKSE